MNFDITEEVSPAHDNDDSDFKFALPLPDWDDGKPFDSSLNCYGVVYVRLLCVQRLPCPVGSSVCAAVSLPPWQGRVRTHRTAAFLSSFDHGVCVRWDQNTNAGFCSMVNAWNSEESPVPSIRVDVMFSPLGMGLFDFTMCSLVLPCQILMKSPGTWKEQWCQTSVQENANGGTDFEKIPLVKLEAMFAPGNEGRSRLNQSTPIPRPRLKDQPDMTTEEPETEELLPSSTTSEPNVPEILKSVPAEEEEVEVEEDAEEDAEEDVNDEEEDDDEKTIEDVNHDETFESQPHLLQVESFWIPATCGVCSKVIYGRNAGFHCEACSIQCCPDCRLHVDLQIPCGSEAARIVAEKSISNKMSVDNILSIVAPDEAFAQKKTEEMTSDDGSVQSTKSSGFKFTSKGGAIGRLKLDFVRACLFDRNMPADSDPHMVFGEKSSQKLRVGDYYARISLLNSHKTARTRTLQSTGMPNFDAAEMQFNVTNYGMEFRLDIIDASTDITVGTALLTTQGILQEQRDILITRYGASLFQFLKGPLQWKGKRLLKLELRTGVKSGFGSDFYSVQNNRRTEKNEGKDTQDAGAISGWLEVRASLEEHVDLLYGNEPFECPPRPLPDLNMMNFQVHISRVKALIDDLKYGWGRYQYMISWKNPALTFTLLVVFVAFCLLFNAEYIGSIPILFLLILSVRFSLSQRQKARFVRREIEKRRKAEDISVGYTLHRPIGMFSVSASRGKGLVSRDLGIPGRTSCHIFWDPLRYTSEKSKHAIAKIDRSADSQHEIGSTGAHYSSEPLWDEMFESVESRRLKQLFPLDGSFFEPSTVGPGLKELIFPVLQPFEVRSSRKDTAGRFRDSKLKDWITSPSAIVVQVRFQDFLNNLPGFDHVLGEVVIPFSKLVADGEISGWFEVLDSTTSSVPLSVDKQTGPDDEGKLGLKKDNNESRCIFVSLKWKPPQPGIGEGDESTREASHVIQEELVRSSVLVKQNKFDLVESSLGAVNTALGIGGNVQLVQNYLGAILDSIECGYNAFNFVDPFKSSAIFLVLLLVWIILVLVPTRYIVLCIGLSQFGVAFIEQYGHKLRLTARPTTDDGDDVATELLSDPSGESKENPFAIWIMNALRSLPTSEDLRRTYYWESRRLGSQESENYASEKRFSRLKRLWRAQWYSPIRLRVHGTQDLSSTNDDDTWQAAFAIIQGHRFLWWKEVKDFDNGELPVGRIFLSGHAGLTGPTPIEMKELTSEELPRIVGIFGRGLHGQERVTILTPDSVAQEQFQDTVREVFLKDE